MGIAEGGEHQPVVGHEHVAQVVGIAHRRHPSVVNRQEPGAGDLDVVASHCDDRRGGRGQPKHFHRHLALVLAQQVVDRQPFEQVAAGRVDVDDDVVGRADGAQGASDALRGHTFAGPEVDADRVEHRNSVVLFGGGHDVRRPAIERARREVALHFGARAVGAGHRHDSFHGCVSFSPLASQADNAARACSESVTCPSESIGAIAVCTVSTPALPPIAGRFSFMRHSSRV